MALFLISSSLFLRSFCDVSASAFASDGALIDQERLHFSAGQLQLPHKLAAKREDQDAQKMVVSWWNDPGSGIARGDDELMMMVPVDGKLMGPIKTGALREQESAVIQLPSSVVPIRGIYLFFGSDKRKLYSADVYFNL